MRRLFGSLATVMILILSISACAHPSGAQGPAVKATAAAPTKLDVAYSEIVFANLPLWVAKDAGIFEKNGLDVNVEQINSSNAVAALLAGSVQVSHVGGSEVLSADVGGADLEVVGTLGATYPYQLMVQPDIKTVDDLRGKKIGISSPGSSSDIATRVTLRRLGLDPDTDVTIVPVGSLANRTAALMNGAIDAGLDSPPGTIKQEAAGLHPLVSLADLGLPAANNTITMQRSFVEQNPDVVQRYVNSMVEAMDRIRTDRAFSIKTLESYYQSDDEDAMTKTYEYALKLMPDMPYPTTEQFGDAVDSLAAKNEDVKSFDVSSILNSTFVQTAANENLGKAATTGAGGTSGS